MRTKVKRLLSPKGRLAPSPYWRRLAVLLTLNIGLNALAHFRLAPEAFLLVASFPICWMTFCIVAKRLHDFGADVTSIILAWVGLGLLAGIGFVIAAAFGAHPLVLGLLGLSLSLAPLGFLIWTGLQRGTPFRNAHGRGGSAAPGAMPMGQLTP